MKPLELVARWREQAAAYERDGQPGAAVLKRVAAELEGVLAHAAAETLTLARAAQECGYSADHLGRLVKAGKLANLGRTRAPRLRRADLPRKAVLSLAS